MKKLLLSLCLVFLGLNLMAAAPEVYDVFAEQQDDVVAITYHLLHPDEKMCNITVQASADGGLTYDIIPTALSGDIGIIEATAQGAEYHIYWTYGLDSVSSGTNYRVKVIADDDIPAIPGPNVVVLTAADLPFFVQMDESNLVMLLGAPPNYYALGTILIMAPTPQIPSGIMRKVVGSFVVGNLVYLETVSATLEEAFQQVQFEFSEPLKSSDIVSATPLLDGVTFLPPAKDFSLPTISLDVTIPLDDGVELTVNGELDITLGYDFSVKIGMFKGLYSLKAGGHGDVDTSIELGINGGFSVDKDIEIAEYTFAVISFMAGPVPVWMTPSISVVLQLEAGGGASITTTVSSTASFSAGVKYDKYASSKWSTYFDRTIDFDYDPPSLSVGLHASAAIGPQLELNLYSVAGPYVFAGGYLDLSADFLATPWWTLKGGFKVDAGVEFEVLSFELSWGVTVFDYSVILAQASTPPPQDVSQPTFSPGAGSYEAPRTSPFPVPPTEPPSITPLTARRPPNPQTSIPLPSP